MNHLEDSLILQYSDEITLLFLVMMVMGFLTYKFQKNKRGLTLFIFSLSMIVMLYFGTNIVELRNASKEIVKSIIFAVLGFIGGYFWKAKSKK